MKDKDNKNPTPDLIKVYSRVSLNKTLMDTRYTSNCYVFGKVGQVARQYGIKVKNVGVCNEFEAPKFRMQLFVEKLHFGGIPFSEQPY